MKKSPILMKGVHIAVMAISIFYMSSFGVLVIPQQASATDICLTGDGSGVSYDVKYNVDTGYEYGEEFATITIIDGDPNSVTWEPKDGYIITFVCVKEGGPGGGTAHFPDPDDGQAGPYAYDISHVGLVVEEQEVPGTLMVHKLADTDGDGSFEITIDSEGGFRWQVSDSDLWRVFGTSVDLAPGEYQVWENDISGYHPVGWTYGSPESFDGNICEDSELSYSTTAPVTITSDETTDVTFCNALDTYAIRVFKWVDPLYGEPYAYEGDDWTWSLNDESGIANNDYRIVFTGADHVITETPDMFPAEDYSSTWECWYGEGEPAGSGAGRSFSTADLTVTPENDWGVYCAFTNEELGGIHGQKWNDLNGNGDPDCSTGEFQISFVNDQLPFTNVCEPYLNDWTIFIDENGNGELDAGEQSMQTQYHDDLNPFTSDDNGWYWFDGLPQGTYTVCEIPQEGWNQTFPATDNNCHTVSVPQSFDRETPDTCSSEETLNSILAPSCNFGNQEIPYEPVCGNEKLDEGEQCDDGNTTDGDGCSALCQNEPEVVTLELAKVNDQQVSEGGDGLLEQTEIITYRIDWGVDGNSDATDVILTDIIPEELNLNVASISNGGTWDVATRTITWDFGTQNPGTTGFVTYTATVLTTVPDGTDIINVARLSASNSDPLFIEVESPVEVNVPVVLGEETEPILSIEKTVNAEFVNPNSVVTYTVVITNTGDGTAFNVTLTDTLPAGFTFQDGGGNTKTWNLGDIAQGGEKLVTYIVNVGTDLEAGDYINVAVAGADNHEDIDDSASVEVRIPAVLADTVPETGASTRDYLVFVASMLMIGFGVYFNRKGQTVTSK